MGTMELYGISGRVVLENGIADDGVVIVEGEHIAYAGPKKDIPENMAAIPIVPKGGRLIGPGFVDIHCHAAGGFEPGDVPLGVVAGHMLEEGTTGLLVSIYRSVGHERTLEALDSVKAHRKSHKNILGAHMEGPYLNPRYGSVRSFAGVHIDKKRHGEILQKGIVVQWTFSPEIEGSGAFLADIAEHGVVPAIGHSEADIEAVRMACEGGARIVTHIFNATGCGKVPPFEGVKALSFDQAAMLCEGLFYEVICDRRGCHVPYDMLRLLLKTVGIDRVIAITDFTRFSKTGEDITLIEVEGKPELYGSALTMRRVANNLAEQGFSPVDIFKMTSRNPALGIGVYGRMGSLEKGKLADIVVADGAFSSVETILHGKTVQTGQGGI